MTDFEILDSYEDEIGENFLVDFTNTEEIQFEFESISNSQDWEYEFELNSDFEDESEENHGLKLAIFTYFVNQQNRLNSYLKWPQALVQKPKDLSASGLFYTKYSDKVTCFSCGGNNCLFNA
jgi:hypothetical protein